MTDSDRQMVCPIQVYSESAGPFPNRFQLLFFQMALCDQPSGMSSYHSDKTELIQKDTSNTVTNMSYQFMNRDLDQYIYSICTSILFKPREFDYKTLLELSYVN